LLFTPETTLKADQVNKLIANTHFFVFILSEGIFDAPERVEGKLKHQLFKCVFVGDILYSSNTDHAVDLRIAIEQHRRILFVRDFMYTVPSPLPSSVHDLRSVWDKFPVLIYMAEFYNEFTEQVTKLTLNAYICRSNRN
jgi:hypothetical protein